MSTNINFNYDDDEAFRDSIATVDAKGKRIWIYPKIQKGRFYQWRTYLSWAFLAFLFGAPFIKIGGEPLLLFNVLERKFILFGLLFTPQDFHLFVLAMITFIVFIILFTVIYGRLFCGWICPQTVFMEMVFRKIEYWIEGDTNAQRRLNSAPWTSDKVIKKVGKQAVFFAISVLVANTFLAYIIGVEEVMRIVTEPVSMHIGGFTSMLLFSGAFYFVFSYLREQVCIAICPYGRLQGVLLDNNSIVVAYDFVRGEPRGKIKKAAPSKATNPLDSIAAAVASTDVATMPHPSDPLLQISNKATLGDCIDCSLCVRVCPTGIDIRNGTQLECINCTLCIDACDEVMVKVDRPKGLIRYDSLNGIKSGGQQRVFTPRVIAYTALLAVLLVINVVLLTSRGVVETIILRTPGMLYQETEDGQLSNLYKYQIFNKTTRDMQLSLRLKDSEGRIRLVGEMPASKAGEMMTGAFFIDLPKDQVKERTTKIALEVLEGDEVLDRASTNFLGPIPGSE